MKKITLSLTIILFTLLNSKAQTGGLLLQQFNAVDSTWGIREQNTPGTTYQTSISWFHVARHTTTTRTPDIKFPGLINKSNGSISGKLLWFGTDSLVKVSPVSDLSIPFSQITSVPTFTVNEADPGVPTYAKSLTAFSVIKTSTDAVYEPLFSKNTGFNKNFGTASGEVAQGNDSRILNGQTAFGWGNHASAGYLLSSTAASTYQPLLPSQAGNNGKVLTTNGSTLSWDTPVTSAAFNTNPGRTLSTTGSNNTFTISTTQRARVNYTINFSVALISVSSNGLVSLDYSLDAGSSWIPVSSVSQVYGVSILTTSSNNNLSGEIPANALVRIYRSANTNVTVTISSAQQEVTY